MTPSSRSAARFGLEQTVTAGIVSALHRQMTAPNDFTINDSIQTDAAINHGNSGGPLLDLEGKVVGVNAQIASDSGGNDGIGFAIPSNTVKSIVSQLLSSGEVVHAYLGVGVEPAAAVAISEVKPGTPAADAGLESGDVIISAAGNRRLRPRPEEGSGREEARRHGVRHVQPRGSEPHRDDRAGQPADVKLSRFLARS